MNNYLKIAILIIGIQANSCKSTNTANVVSNQSKSEKLEAAKSSLTLLDRLKRIPGIRVQNGDVYVRAQNGARDGATASVKPLFILDGQQIGNDIGAIENIVDPNDIKSVRLIKGVEAIDYGLRGSGGVILITTKIKE